MRRFALVAVLVVAAACTSGGPEPEPQAGTPAATAPTAQPTAVADPAEVVRRVAEAISAVRSVHMTFEQQMWLSDGPQLMNKGTGAIDLAGGTGEVLLDLPDIPGDDATPDAMRIVWERDVMYVKGMPDAPRGRPWLRMDTRKMDGIPGLESMREAMTQGSADLGMLYGAQDVEAVGPDELDGVETTRYALTADFATAVREIPADQRQALERYLRKFRGDSLEIDIWVDDREELRRLEYAVDGSDLAGRVGKQLDRVVTVVDFEKFDAPVSVDIPPKRATIDMLELIDS